MDRGIVPRFLSDAGNNTQHYKKDDAGFETDFGKKKKFGPSVQEWVGKREKQACVNKSHASRFRLSAGGRRLSARSSSAQVRSSLITARVSLLSARGRRLSAGSSSAQVRSPLITARVSLLSAGGRRFSARGFAFCALRVAFFAPCRNKKVAI